MKMKTQEIGLLSSGELDAVVGGMMNNGQGDLLQTPKNRGGPTGQSDFGQLMGGLTVLGLAIGTVLGATSPDH
jgi:hypothetical protein